MRQRLRQEDGFTLPELLITMTIGLILVLATLTLVEVTMRRTGETSDRIEALQGGRLTMDTVTRELRSRVCLARTTGTDVTQISIESASPDSITFYADMRDTSDNRNGVVATPVPGYISGPGQAHDHLRRQREEARRVDLPRQDADRRRLRLREHAHQHAATCSSTCSARRARSTARR